MLVLAAAVLGTMVALVITHVVWSSEILFLLPSLLDWLS
jgi:hypothetical protein